MSLHGFDSNGASQGRQQGLSSESYDFQETYDGLGEEINTSDDALNEETFGGTENISKDFDFGATMGQASQPATSGNKPGVTYAQAVSQANNDDEFMQDLWGPSNPTKTPPSKPDGQGAGERKVLSLEEIEAQLTSIANPQQVPPQQNPMGMPNMMFPPQYGGYMMPPPGVIPPGNYGQFPGVAFGETPQHITNNGMQAVNRYGVAMPSQTAPPPSFGPNVQAQFQPPPQAAPPSQPALQSYINSPIHQTQQPSQVGDFSVNQKHEPPVVNGTNNVLPHISPSQFPVLGSKVTETGQNQVPQVGKILANRNQRTSTHSPYHPVDFSDLPPEQQQKFTKRHEKAARIMKYSGIMNPKDKDFVTRFQLSQIVTDDPYNEDFYAQVFRVIHPRIRGGYLQEPTQPNNSIAQAYLDQSGHRLGGRYKRADVALQRMQQQVQKAVTVAKERPKLTQYAREGSLGKISVGNGKKPRQQLEIFSQAAQNEIDKQEARESGEQKQGQEAYDLESKIRKFKSPAITGPSEARKKFTKKDIMSILENIISNVMAVESKTRVSNDVDTSELWESLHIFDQNPTAGGSEEEVNPFIQCLNYNKALKILGRLFKFLSREQILTIVTLIMANLEKLKVIKEGSYSTYPDKKVPGSIVRLIDLYSVTFSKVLMNAVQEFRFNEIIGLLVILIEHNNVAFVSTTKIGLSILTTLLSRAELIKGEGSISATDLSEWSACYDELFTSLESRIAEIFPPHPDNFDDGSSKENYVWQFLATLSLGGKLSHQRIIVDEVRDQIFGVMNRAKAIDNLDVANLYKKQNLLNNLNMYLVVMGLVADENDILELQS